MVTLPDKPDGSNVLPVTPVPLQVPPGVPVTIELRLSGASPAQMDEGSVNAGLPVGITLMWIVSVSPQVPAMEYVMVLEPADAVAGLNTPADETPVPLQVPPGLAAVSVMAEASWHNAATEVIVASAVGVTLIVCVCVPVQGLAPTVYVTEIAPDKPDGLKVLPVTPVPLQVPPGVPVTSVFRSTGAADEHIGDAVQFGLELGTTVI